MNEIKGTEIGAKLATSDCVAQFAADNNNLRQQIEREQDKLHHLMLKSISIREKLTVHKQRPWLNPFEHTNLSPVRVSSCG